MLPGAPAPWVLPNAPITIDALDASLDKHGETCDELLTQFLTDFSTTFQSVSHVYEELVANILGGIDNRLDAVEQTIVKFAKSKIDAVDSSLMQAYGYLVSMGYQVPTLDAVNYGLQTGDYMGSMTPVGELQPQFNEQPQQTYPPLEPPIIAPIQPVNPPSGETGGDTGTVCPCDTMYVHVDDPSGTLSWLQPMPLFKDGGYKGVFGPFPSADPTLPDYRIFVEWSPPTDGADYLFILGQSLSAGPPTGCFPWVDPSGETKCDTKTCCFVHDGYINGLPSDNPSTLCPQAGTPIKIIVSCQQTLEDAKADCSNAAECSGGTQGGNGGSTGGTGETCSPPWCKPPDTSPPVCKDYKPSCETPFPFKPPQLGTDIGDVCLKLQEAIDNFKPNFGNIEDLFKFKIGTSFGANRLQDFVELVTGRKDPIVPNLLGSFGKWLSQAIERLSTATPCNIPAIAPLSAYGSLIGWLEHWFGVIPPKIREQLEQLQNFACQLTLPSPGEADEAFLANMITKDIWECWQKVAGHRTKEAESVLNSKRERLNSRELCQLLRRKLIDEKQFADEMRNNGVLNDDDRKRIFDSTQHIMSETNLIQFMRHNIGDPEVVARNQLDKDFDKKFLLSQRMVDYADAIGMTQDQVLDLWRVHWQYPSYTQQTTMLQRNRPGRVPENEVVTKEDVQKLLETIDFAPAWVDAMIAISYRPPTREDAVKVYNYDGIGEDELGERFQDVGYSEEDADFLVGYYKKKKQLDSARKAGNPPITTLVRQYAKCLITYAELENQAELVAENQQQLQQAIGAASFMRDVQVRENQYNGILYQYRRGLIDETQATQALADAGFDPECVPHLIQKMQNQKQSKPKQVGAAALCKMRSYNIITAEEQLNAIIRLGYAPQDAIRIVQQCAATLSEQQIAKLERQAAKEQAKADKAARELAKRLKREECGPPVCPKNSTQNAGEPIPGL